MKVYKGTDEENLADFILKIAPTEKQILKFKIYGIIKIDGIIHISDPFNILA